MSACQMLSEPYRCVRTFTAMLRGGFQVLAQIRCRDMS